MANVASITVLQIGTGQPLPSPGKVMGIPALPAPTVKPTQDQNGGGVPYDNYIQNPATAAAVYSRIEVPNGSMRQPTIYFSSEKVQAVLNKLNAALA